MAKTYRNLIYSTAEYTHTHGGFCGTEQSASSLTSSGSRLAHSVNMFKDYGGDGADVIESVPGFRCFAHYGKQVHAIYYQRSPSGDDDHLLVHVGNELIRHPVSDIYKKNTQGVCITAIEDTQSFGFEYGRYFYVMDTERIFRIDEDGVCTKVGESGAYPYIPTTYVSGEPHEQRNLLTRDFKEEFYVSDPRSYLFASDGLKFNVIDPYLRYCSVSGAEATLEGEAYLPSYVDIAGVSYKVISVENSAFEGNTSIRAVYIADGIEEIGARAFSGCTSLATFVTPSTVTKINEKAFYGCTSLAQMYLGASVEFIGEDAFSGISSTLTVNYALGEDELTKIEGAEEISGTSIVYSSRYDAVKISLPFHDDVEGITEVSVNGEATEYDATDDGEIFTSIVLTFQNISSATGITVIVKGKLTPLGDGWASDMMPLEEITPYKAIAACRTAEVFDGRIFFSGNPTLPNTVFYTERVSEDQCGALYVGCYNYFNDGIGSHAVKSLLAVRDMLAVFKEGNDGSGSVFYHKKESSGFDSIDTIYPVEYVHSGICSLGGSFTFLDDPVFITSEGIMALNSQSINYQRNVVCRSHNVNYTLLKEDLTKAYLCEWLGYLAVGVNGKIFLADSRAVFSHPSGSREYEWFMLDGIGAYKNDNIIYRYSPDAYYDTVAHPTLVGEAATHNDVYSEAASDGTLYYYIQEDGVKYSVVQTEEMGGGEFCPATTFISHEKHLFFATSDGHLCVFNNDMRGIAPESVKASSDYDEDAYKDAMGGKIHPLFYSFAGHAPKYEIKTALDDCGVPHLTKNTVKKSLVIKAKSYLPDAIACYVSTDKSDPVYVGSFPSAAFDFSSFDFSASPWYTSKYLSVALPEKEKRWIEKQITLTSSTFASPISVYSITYRYTIKGKIKNNI